MANRGEPCTSLSGADVGAPTISQCVKDRSETPDRISKALLQISPRPFPANLGEVRNGAELLKELRQEAQAILAYSFILGHHQHVLEETVHSGSQSSDDFERLAVMTSALLSVHLRCRFPYRRIEVAFGGVLEELRLNALRLDGEPVGLLEDLPNTLEGHGEWLEVARLADATKRLEALLRVNEVIRARAKDGIDFIIGEAQAFAEKESGPVEDEFEDLGFLPLRQRYPGRIGMEGLFRSRQGKRERYCELAVKDNLDDSLSGTAKREGIAGTRGNNAHGEASGYGIKLVREGHGAANQIARARIFEARRKIVIVDGISDDRRLS